MRVLLINASAPTYNLGLEKAQNWWLAQGAVVERANALPRLWLCEYDAVWVSAIFSWHVPSLVHLAQEALQGTCRVEVGGPGTFGLRAYIHEHTGLWPQSTPDARFERQPGTSRMVFWSRGCPAKNCSPGFPRDGALPVCSVPQMEGWKYTLYTDVQPAPIILDNNLSALPVSHQELIIERTLSAGFSVVDANSGFEPRSIRAETIERWRRVPLLAWRFAYDELAERTDVLRTLQ